MQPLAERMRPKSLEEYSGQEHLVGEKGVLRKMITSGRINSLILWGPPGVGKTTLARILSQQSKRPFHSLSAISSGVKDVREVIEMAKKERFFNTPAPILFIDEIHRFSKSQQDALLAAVEQGTVVLIGATTENPSFEVIPALLSRCPVYILKSMEIEQMRNLLEKALKEDEFLSKMDIEIVESEALFRIAGGDARKLLNALEITVNGADTNEKIQITNELVINSLQQNLALYDKNGEMHYDIISAYIKSIRGSDPNAAVYWLARMIEGGEDVTFIARRLVILASEDIGLANPNALLMATQCFDAVKAIGFPRVENHPIASHHLPCHFRQEQHGLHGHRGRTRQGTRNGKSARSVTPAQRTDKTDEKPRIWKRISILPQLRGQFCKPTIFARRPQRNSFLYSGQQYSRKTN
jgi:putative ATPase